MLQERLLERLRHAEQDPDHRGVVDPNEVVNSIMKHLRKILNTRQGSAPIADDYGVPDFTDLAANFSLDTIRDLARSIRQVVIKYEPRLTDVVVEAEPKNELALEILFKIDARLTMGDDTSMAVSFMSIIDADGRIQVNR